MAEILLTRKRNSKLLMNMYAQTAAPWTRLNGARVQMGPRRYAMRADVSRQILVQEHVTY